MPVYAPKVQDSDASPGTGSVVNKVLSPNVETASTFMISIGAGGAAQNIHFVTDAWLINSDAWESGGTMSCKLRVTAVTGAMRARCMIRRISRTGALLQSGTFTTFQTLTGLPGTFTFTPTVPTWTAGEENCGNRLAIRFSIDNTSAGASTATIEVGTANSEITSTITENNGNCRRIFIA